MTESEDAKLDVGRVYRELPTSRVDDILPLARYAHSVRPSESTTLTAWLTESVDAGKRLFAVYDSQDRDPDVVACWLLHPYTMRFRESLVSMGGVGLVSSRPDRRGQGNIRLMMTQALKTMREAGNAVSVLYPFHIGFYRKYGWESFTEWMRYEISPGILAVPDGENPITTTDLAFPDEASKTFYNNYARTHYNFALRDDIHWQARLRLWSDEQIARGVVQAERHGEVVGLMGYTLFHKHDAENPVLNISLFAASNEQAKQALLAYLKRQSHQVTKIELHLPLDEPLWPYLSDYASAIKLQQMAMLRVVDLALLDGLEIAAPNTALCIAVEDAQAPWNNGPWTLAAQDRVLHVEKGGTPMLRSGIGPLSAVLSGFTNVGAMLACGKMTALPGYHGEDLPKQTTLLVDFF